MRTDKHPHPLPEAAPADVLVSLNELIRTADDAAAFEVTVSVVTTAQLLGHHAIAEALADAHDLCPVHLQAVDICMDDNASCVADPELCGVCGQHHGPALTDCDLFNPEDWAVLSDAVMHTLGVLPNDGQGCFACYVADETDPHSVCPDHGAQRVTGHYSTRGADPYDVEKLACGCDVICMGPGEPMTVVHVDEARARRHAAEEGPDAAQVQAYAEVIESAVDGRW